MDGDNSPQLERLDNGVTLVRRPDGSSEAIRAFNWTPDSTQAASDVAEGTYSLREIANRAGVSQMALKYWRTHPEFMVRVEEHRKVYRQLVLQYGIAKLETRMAHLQNRHDAICLAVQERGKFMAETYPDMPGAATGYVALKPTAHGDLAYIDAKTAQLLAEMEKQAAISVGEWNEGSSTGVAVQIVVPAGAPPAADVPTITIGSRQI